MPGGEYRLYLKGTMAGIRSMDNGKGIMDNRTDKAYDLQGRPVVNPQRGLYIKNGQKIYVK